MSHTSYCKNNTHRHKLIQSDYVVKAYPCYFQSTKPLHLATKDKNKRKSHLTPWVEKQKHHNYLVIELR